MPGDPNDPKKDSTAAPDPKKDPATTVPKKDPVVPVPKKDAGASDPKGESKKDDLDKALEQFAKIKEKVGEQNLKAFLESYGKEDSPLKEKKTKSDAEKAKALAKDQKSDTQLKDWSKSAVGFPKHSQHFGASYGTVDWDIESIDKVDNPATLSVDDWAVVLATTGILHGFVVQPDGTVSRARKPAFKLKAAVQAGKPEEPIKPDALINFHVFDDSSITIKESTTMIEKSLARNGFSANAIKGSVSGGGGSISAAVSGAVEFESQSGLGTALSKEEKQYTACYNFPRARVFLDELDLDLTDECERMVNELITLKDTAARSEWQKFFGYYGHIFATTFLLGGQLTATKFASSLANSQESAKHDAMKADAAVSVESRFVSASASGSMQRASDDKSKSTEIQNRSELAWSARGGNTLLAVNPSEWANSVGQYSTWRAIEQDGVQGMTNLISKLERKSGNRPYAEFTNAWRVSLQRVVESPKQPPRWTGKFKLEIFDDNRSIKWDGKHMVIAGGRDAPDATIFRVMDADINSLTRKDPVMRDKLRSDWPLFLTTAGDDNNWERPENRNTIFGMWATDDDKISREVIYDNKAEIKTPNRRICRWSLRFENRENFDTKWDPRGSLRELQDGDKVHLHCHYCLGGTYRDVKDPPFYAAAVGSKKEDKTEFLVLKKVPTTAFKGDVTTGLPGLWGMRNMNVFDKNPKLSNLGRDSDANTRDYLSRFENNEESATETKLLETYRKICGFNHQEVYNEFLADRDVKFPEMKDALNKSFETGRVKLDVLGLRIRFVQ